MELVIRKLLCYEWYRFSAGHQNYVLITNIVASACASNEFYIDKKQRKLLKILGWNGVLSYISTGSIQMNRN